MFNRYFQQELSYLRELGTAFAENNPALAPMLSGGSSDPDVERLLEGVAFLTAQIREKLDDEFPEIIHELIQLIWPHYLRPVPSCSIIRFTPKPSLKQPLIVKAGVQVASIPVEDTVCMFQTCYDTEIHPLQVVNATYSEPPGKPPIIKLDMKLQGLTLATWQPETLRFYLGGNLAEATSTYLLLRQHITRVIIATREGEIVKTLPGNSIRAVGFSAEQGAFPYPPHSFSAYRLLQEYFTIPQKFLFLDLTGLSNWAGPGSDNVFELFFELSSSLSVKPRIRKESFQLFATPVINLFPFEADPIRIDHRQSEYLVRPSSNHADHYQIYSIENVTGHVQGTAQERKYSHYNCFSPAEKGIPVYQISLKNSPVRAGADSYLQISYPQGSKLPSSEILSLSLLCTNGDLPEQLRVGDICKATSSTPDFADFANIMQPTLGVYPPLGNNLLWRLLAHLNLNHVSLANADNLKALLNVYLFPDTKDRSGLLANRRRIQSIEKIVAQPANRLISSLVLRGLEIAVTARSDHFASEGDFYLFGCILDEFFALYASLNSFTRFQLKDSFKGESHQWPPRIGRHPLI